MRVRFCHGECSPFVSQMPKSEIKPLLWSAVRQGTAEHLDGMLSEQQRIDDTVETAAQRQVRGFGIRLA